MVATPLSDHGVAFGVRLFIYRIVNPTPSCCPTRYSQAAGANEVMITFPAERRFETILARHLTSDALVSINSVLYGLVVTLRRRDPFVQERKLGRR